MVISLGMQKLLLLVLLLISFTTFSQRGFLYVKKKGFKKVKTFAEGDAIKFHTKDGQVIYGGLALVNRDSVYVNGHWFPVADVSKIILRDRGNRSFDPEMLLWTTAGVALSTTGITLAKWNTFQEALGYSAGLGFGNYLIRYFPSLKRKKYVINRKFSLQTLDLHF